MVDVAGRHARARAPRKSRAASRRPLERLLWEIPGVEYVYSHQPAGTLPGRGALPVGEDVERSLVKLNQKLQRTTPIASRPACHRPLIKARSIDDVPILALTFHCAQLRPSDAASGGGPGRRGDQARARGVRDHADRRLPPRRCASVSIPRRSRRVALGVTDRGRGWTRPTARASPALSPPAIATWSSRPARSSPPPTTSARGRGRCPRRQPGLPARRRRGRRTARRSRRSTSSSAPARRRRPAAARGSRRHPVGRQASRHATRSRVADAVLAQTRAR